MFFFFTYMTSGVLTQSHFFREDQLSGIAHRWHVARIPCDDLHSCSVCRPHRPFLIQLWYLCSLLSQIRACSSQQFSNDNQHPSIFNPQHIDCPDIVCQPYHEDGRCNSGQRDACQPAPGCLHCYEQEGTETSAKPTSTEHGHVLRWPRKLCWASCVSCSRTIACPSGGLQPLCTNQGQLFVEQCQILALFLIYHASSPSSPTSSSHFTK